MMRPSRLLWLLSLGVLCGSVLAVEAHLGGFGTLSGSCFSNRSADYVANNQPEGPGRTRDCDAGLDSLIGVQLDLELDQDLAVGLQVLADRNPRGDFDPEVSSAQLRWRAADDTTIRAGRLPSASFLHAENRQVRYAMPWVRPPLEVYGLLPVFVQDGVDVLHVQRLGSWTGEWHAGLVKSDFEYPVSNTDAIGSTESRSAFLHLTLQRGGTRVKAGYAYGRVELDQPGLQPFLDALSATGPDGAALADDLAPDESTTWLAVFGLSHEQSDWVFSSEVGYRMLDGAYRDQIGAYATLGRRLGPWLPYVTLARRWTRGEDGDDRAVALGPQWQAAVEQYLAASRWDTTSVAFGVAREVSDDATLKFQADWVRPDHDSWGLLTNHGPDYDFADPGSDWLFTLSLDFVF